MSDLKGRNLVRDLGEVPPGRFARQRAALVARVREREPRRRLLPASMAFAAVAAAAVVVLVIVPRLTAPKAPVQFWVGTVASPGREGAAIVAVEPVSVSFAEGSKLTWGRGSNGKVLRASTGAVTIGIAKGDVEAQITPSRDSHLSWQFDAAGYTVRVTGTKLRLRVDQQTLEVLVTEGAVGITGPGAAHGVTVPAGSVATAQGGRLDVTPAVSAQPPAVLGSQSQVPSATAASESETSRTRERGIGRVSPARSGTVAAGSEATEWKVLAADKHYAEALAAAEAVGFARLTTRLSAQDLALLADVARFARSAPQARQALNALQQRFPRDPRARLVPFMLGRVAFDLEADPKTGAVMFRRYLDAQPKGALAEEARGRLIEALRDSGSLKDARAAAEDYLQLYANGIYADLARSLLNPVSP